MTHWPTPYFSGCSLGPYRETFKRTAQAASVSEQSVTLPAGLPGSVVAVTGADAPPKITLVGPKGERITTPDTLMPVETKPFFLMKNPQAKLTQIAIMRPSGGRWKVIVEDGSSPITSLKVAHAHGGPEDRGDRGRQGPPAFAALLRRAASRPGRRRSSSAARAPPARSARAGARGELKFSPAAGAAERREIVAIVEQDGMVSDQIVVARYQAPSASKPGIVRQVRTARRGSTLKVTWKPASLADKHVVTVALSNGRRVVRQVQRPLVRRARRGRAG